jgi:hypothetical protein
MFGFSVMVRPDMLAEMLGVGGFFLSGHRSRRGIFAGCVLLVLAMLTKQTAAVFLLAAALALWFEGRGRLALGVLGGCLAGLAAVVAASDVWLEPNLVRSLLGESKMPWGLDGWLRTLGRVLQWSPDLLLFPAIGLWLWSGQRPRETRLSTLAVIVLAASLGTSGKRGADLNYYLSLRIVAALAAGTLWHLAGQAAARRSRAALAFAIILGAAALVPSVQFAVSQATLTARTALIMRGPAGRSVVRTYQGIIRAARDPDVRLLTDAGLFDLYQGERAAFGDPWMFRMLAQTGQVQPVKMQRWIDSEAYDLIVTTSDLFTPGYETYEFGLPMTLVERARVHYTPAGSGAGLFFYRRRGRENR